MAHVVAPAEDIVIGGRRAAAAFQHVLVLASAMGRKQTVLSAPTLLSMAHTMYAGQGS